MIPLLFIILKLVYLEKSIYLDSNTLLIWLSDSKNIDKEMWKKW